jgi:hypothetical protein
VEAAEPGEVGRHHHASRAAVSVDMAGDAAAAAAAAAVFIDVTDVPVVAIHTIGNEAVGCQAVHQREVAQVHVAQAALPPAAAHARGTGRHGDVPRVEHEQVQDAACGAACLHGARHGPRCKGVHARDLSVAKRYTSVPRTKPYID